MMLTPHPVTPPQGNLTPPPSLSTTRHTMREGGVKTLQGGVRVGVQGGVINSPETPYLYGFPKEGGGWWGVSRKSI